ncbi:MAG: sigma 54-interacting transcriptional regulator, partial [Planctomycetales bacterium]|nr:sigma 54-interacting transcriptional regulator [Planctomycetales bacterium]
MPESHLTQLSSTKLLAHTKQHASEASAIVLTLYSVPAGRLSESASATELASDTLELISALNEIPGHPPVILLTPGGTPLDICCSAVRLGVSSCVDLDTPEWTDRLENALTALRTTASAPASRKADPKALLDAVGIMAVSPAMQELIVQVYRGAQVSDATVLIHGESGTGKQLLAEAVHRLDP